MTDAFLFLASKGLGIVVKVDDVKKLQQDLKNDYIINQELSSLAGGNALRCGRWLALANAAVITTTHIKLEPEPEPDLIALHETQPTHPSRDSKGYPLEGLDVVGCAAAAGGRANNNLGETWEEPGRNLAGTLKEP